MKNQTIVIRVDADSSIGAGHFMRCFAFAQKWISIGGSVTFVCARLVPHFDEMITSIGAKLIIIKAIPGSSDDANKTVIVAIKKNSLWIIADGYKFDGSYQKQIKLKNICLVIFDDYGHTDKYFSDYIINQNIDPMVDLYSQRSIYTKLLLGEKYFQLRKEFEEYNTYIKKISKQASRILITFGGSDPNNYTLKILKAINQINEIKFDIRVILGSANQNINLIKKELKKYSSEIKCVIDTNNLSKHMEWADVAIASSGTTAYELAFMGLPAILIVIADNQAPVAHQFSKKGIYTVIDKSNGFDVDNFCNKLLTLCYNYKSRAEIYKKAKNLIDGKGTMRLSIILLTSFIYLRDANEGDSETIFNWANEKAVRNVSFNPDHIEWKQHQIWFYEKLNSNRCFYYIAVNRNGKAIGQTRFDINDENAEISISIDNKYRGKGYGSAVILLSCEKLFKETQVVRIYAKIKKSNKASKNAFGYANFQFDNEYYSHNEIIVKYVLLRNNM